ncbi:addiction module antidote protein, HigA family [Brucella thiophenivorans]|uniref:Addiction module antidote protein, HigA family n=2 Tax=Brucella thiophenivorans TaxID=571255 RepID=A0A256FTS0_9HYPH|nr:addiction module antidote protein, HigA family [Brucella thiophenivorans]
MNPSQTANALGIGRDSLFHLMNQNKNLTAALAVRLGKFYGTGTLFWLNKQIEYDAWHAESKIDVSNIPTIGMHSRRVAA